MRRTTDGNAPPPLQADKGAAEVPFPLVRRRPNVVRGLASLDDDEDDPAEGDTVIEVHDSDVLDSEEAARPIPRRSASSLRVANVEEDETRRYRGGQLVELLDRPAPKVSNGGK